MNYKLATSRPAQAVVTPDNHTGHDGDGGRTAGTPPAGVGAVGASGSQPCEASLHQASPGAPGAPTARRRRRLFSPVLPSAWSAGPKRAWGRPSDRPAGVADPSPQLKRRTFNFGTWNMLGRTTHTDTGLQPTFLFADDLLALEKLDVLALQETHCDESGPPASCRSRVLAHSGTSCLAAGVALLTPSGSSWSCSSQHSLVPGHALLASLYHGKSTESIWVLCVYTNSSRLIDFYKELILQLSSFIATLPANSWKGCVALGDWNMVEHPADRAPQKAPDSIFRRRLSLFADLEPSAAPLM